MLSFLSSRPSVFLRGVRQRRMRRSLGPQPSALSPSSARQHHRERGAQPDAFAGGADRAAVHLHELLDDGQAEAEAAVLAGDGAALLAEAVEDRGEKLLRD